jgi:hypothetical protein
MLEVYQRLNEDATVTPPNLISRMLPPMLFRPLLLYTRTPYVQMKSSEERNGSLNLILDVGGKDTIFEFAHQFVGLFRQTESQDGVR